LKVFTFYFACIEYENLFFNETHNYWTCNGLAYMRIDVEQYRKYTIL